MLFCYRFKLRVASVDHLSISIQDSSEVVCSMLCKHNARVFCLLAQTHFNATVVASPIPSQTFIGFDLSILFYFYTFNSSDGRVVRASASGAINFGLMPCLVKPMAVTFGIHSFPVWRLASKGQSIIIITQFQSVFSLVTEGGRVHLIPSAIAVTPSLHLVRSAASSIFNPTFFTLSSTCLPHLAVLAFAVHSFPASLPSSVY